MTRPRGFLPAVLLTVAGAAVLVASLFLVWSHQLGPAETRTFSVAVLFGVPADPNAWQVYAITAEVLCVLAAGVVIAGLWGRRTGVAVAGLGVAIALAFVIHAGSHAPTNGMLLATGSGAANRYVTDAATAGPGETVALVGLVLCALGLAVAMLRPGTDRVGAEGPATR